MIKSKFKVDSNKIILLLLAVVIACGVMRIFTFSSGIHDYDTHDFLEDIAWSEATIKSGKLVSPSFLYPYPIPFGGNLLMLPFVYFLGPCLLSNQLGMLVYYALYLLSIFYLAGSIFKEKDIQNIFVIICSLFIFTYIGDNLLHHILYYGIAYVCFICQLASFIRILKNNNKTTSYLVLIASCFFGSVNSASVIVLSNLPTIISIILYGFLLYLYDEKDFIKKKKTIMSILLVVFAITVVGYLVYSIILAVYNGINTTGERLLFGNSLQLAQNIFINSIRDYFAIFGLHDMIVGNLIGFPMFFGQLMFGLLVIIVFVIGTKHIVKQRIKTVDIITPFVFCMVLASISLSFHTFNYCPCERYMFQMVLAMLIICGVYISKLLKENYKYKRYFIVFMIAIVCFFSVKLIRLYEIGNETKSKFENDINILINNNVKIGFSPMKKSVPMYVLSNGKIKFINLDDNTIDFYNHEIDYLDKPNDVDTFFAIIHKEIVTDEELSKSIRIIENDDYYILIYDIIYWDEFVNSKDISSKFNQQAISGIIN